MHRLSIYAKTVLTLCAAALLAGCGETSNGDGFGYLRAFGFSYMCAGEIPGHSSEADWNFDVPLSLKEATSLLPEGVFWLEGVDAHGESITDSVLVGVSGWMHDGVKSEHDLDEYVRCVLQDTAKGILSGECITWKRYARVLPSDVVEIAEFCMQSQCAFSAMRKSNNVTMDAESASCLNPHYSPVDLEDSLATDSASVSIVMNDSIVEIKVLDSKVTWTKRPGL